MQKWKQRKPHKPFGDFDGIIEQLAAIHGIDDVQRFTNPTANELHDPYLLKNIDLARNRILKAMRDKEMISIYADVDFDGCSSCAIMYRYLRNFTENVTYFHAQRSDGHGIYQSKNDIPVGTQLLIIVDSSSDEVETCKEISERGIDIVILDHHEMKKTNNHCTLVNPQQHDCNYPNKNASGSLITWKMCQILDENLGEEYSWDYVDLAGTGVFSDQMSMLEFENRYIVKTALDNINNLGLKAALKVMDKQGELSTTDIGYSITPFVNAATRMDRIELILELLTTDDVEHALKIAKQVKKLNEERKKIQRLALNRIVPMINPDIDDKCIVIVEPSLGKGFNGLIANDLAKIYQKPVVVLGESEEKADEYHGSFRSIGFFNFLKFTESVPEVLFSGGHAGAGGLGIKKERIEQFRRSLNEGLKHEKFENVVTYDLELSADEITEELIREVKSLYRITGKNVYEAKFLIKDLFVLNKKTLGSGDTLKTELCPVSETWFLDEEDYEDLSPKMAAMMFKADDNFIESFPTHKQVDIIGTLNVNEYMRWKPVRQLIKTNQIFIEDYRIVG